MKIHNLLICDDIRAEVGNKISIMGVYGEEIVMNPNIKLNGPVKLPLAFLFRFKIEKNEELPDKFQLEYILNGKKIAPIYGPIQAGNNQKIITLIVKVQFFFEPGPLDLNIKLSKKDKVIFNEAKKQVIMLSHGKK
ncbi:MAG: hypothetical protein CMF39_04960 [Legionellaceae bacterium]|nr:hypothetical protein [Legionellaceae bacterium]|tara:strand:+ start:815 stop:1222 length:408 start_codon:yes stop_codon:yes gene_type:complete